MFANNQFDFWIGFCGWEFSKPFRCFYFRIFGYGLHFAITPSLAFSERMGIKYYLRIGPLVIRTLRRGH